MISPAIASSTDAMPTTSTTASSSTIPPQTAYAFSTLDDGIWYFAVIAVNASGLEGPPTTAAMKSI